jgi:LysM repeat protein
VVDRASPGIAVLAANPVACPYLGLADDARTRFVFATTAHRCRSGSRPERIEITHQESFCLGAGFSACSRFAVSSAAAARRTTIRGSDEAFIAHVNPQIRWRIGRGGRRTLAGGAVVTILGALVLLIVASGLFGQGGVLSGVSGSSPARASVIRPTSTASRSASSPSTIIPSLPTTHIVTRGETLSSIARSYGVAVTAIEKANGIKDPNLIRVGQHLIIPAS